MRHKGRAGRLSCPSSSQTLPKALLIHNSTFTLGFEVELTLALLQLPLRYIAGRDIPRPRADAQGRKSRPYCVQSIRTTVTGTGRDRCAGGEEQSITKNENIQAEVCTRLLSSIMADVRHMNRADILGPPPVDVPVPSH